VEVLRDLDPVEAIPLADLLSQSYPASAAALSASATVVPSPLDPTAVPWFPPSPVRPFDPAPPVPTPASCGAESAKTHASGD
jgi:hypothetical protein